VARSGKDLPEIKRISARLSEFRFGGQIGKSVEDSLENMAYQQTDTGLAGDIDPVYIGLQNLPLGSMGPSTQFCRLPISPL